MAETIRGIGEYDRLNEVQPIEVGSGLTITDLEIFAKSLVAANYGVHRILSSLVRAIEESQNNGDSRFGQIPDALREILINYHGLSYKQTDTSNSGKLK